MIPKFYFLDFTKYFLDLIINNILSKDLKARCNFVIIT
nr:MAG TPA: hypothetical protein [Caudoviricetes sp.]